MTINWDIVDYLFCFFFFFLFFFCMCVCVCVCFVFFFFFFFVVVFFLLYLITPCLNRLDMAERLLTGPLNTLKPHSASHPSALYLFQCKIVIRNKILLYFYMNNRKKTFYKSKLLTRYFT